MRIDIHGCVGDDVHAICIKNGDCFLSCDLKSLWTSNIEESACFLTEARALAAIEELAAITGVRHDVNLIWTDSRLSIYHDPDHLRHFEEQMRKTGIGL